MHIFLFIYEISLCQFFLYMHVINSWYCWCVPLTIVKLVFQIVYFCLVYFVWDSFGHIAFSIVGAKKEQNDQVSARHRRICQIAITDLHTEIIVSASHCVSSSSPVLRPFFVR